MAALSSNISAVAMHCLALVADFGDVFRDRTRYGRQLRDAFIRFPDTGGSLRDIAGRHPW